MSQQMFSDRYSVEGEIARGGMGVIYKAVHTTLGRSVAIKVLHPQYSGDSAFLKRFIREARAMARLDHENIIRVFDVAETNGSHYIVMEFFAGKDLKQLLLEKGRFLPKEALSIGMQVAGALSYAHDKGIVHRDIKLGNIMMDAQGRAKIADFGIAAATDEMSVTATGQIIGTPEYMSPEQARGEHLDGRSDLYSLGMVLYETLTGKTPYEGVSRMAIVGKLIYEHEELPLTFAEDTPEPLRRLITTLLKKKPDDRLPDARTLLVKLREMAEEIGGVIPPESLGVTGQQSVSLPMDEDGPTVMLREAPDITSTPVPATQAPYTSGTIAPQPRYDRVTPPPSPTPPPTGAVSYSPPSPTPPSGVIVKRQSLVPYIAGGAVVVLLAAGLLYYLSSTGEKPQSASNTSSATSSSASPSAQAIFLSQLREVQLSLREMQDRVSGSRAGADAAAAKRWAADTYKKGAALETKGTEAFKEGGRLINSKEYEEAKERMEEAFKFLTEANNEFIRAKEKSLAQAEKDRKAKEASLQRERKEAIAKVKTPPSVPAPSQAVVREKTVATEHKATAPPTKADIDEVGQILSRFKAAYERKDINTLNKITEMSKGRSTFLQQLFLDYSDVRVSITGLSLTGEQASAVVLITRLTNQSGEIVPPVEGWKQSKVVIRREGDNWGKIVW